VALAPSVPEEHRAWLETLLRAAVEDPAFVEARQRVPGVQLHLMDNTEARAMAQDVYDFTFPIFKDLGLYWEDQ
jgi:tripartite-type tricarboxylate transporter receptor subunit TctC